MPFKIDSEVENFATAKTGGKHLTKPAVGDITSRREGTTKACLALFSTFPTHPEVSIQDFYNPSKSDGHSILLRCSAALFIHGGGLVIEQVPMFDRGLGAYVSSSGVPFLSAEYRLAPEPLHPVPVEDIYAGLIWLYEHAEELGVDKRPIAVIGQSVGGRLAAAVTLLARERGGPAVAKQTLVYPILDDRTVVEDPQVSKFLIWTAENNITGWGALLGPLYGTNDIPETAAPGRIEDATGLPPTYIEVGELDLFHEEDIEFARKLWRAGLNTELHIRPGCMHAF